jgi:two-component system, OmpR family, sensor histidine kinase BaeS
MRSLTWKLSLGFLLVGVLGALLVALLVEYRTRSEFDRFLSERDYPAFQRALEEHYAARGSWEGVAQVFEDPAFAASGDDVALTDARGVVVWGSRELRPGMPLRRNMLARAIRLEAGGQTVGFLLRPGGPPGPPGPQGRGRPEEDFLRQVTWGAAVSAGVAALIALVVGTLLARTLTQPIRELTAATRAMAAGRLDQRVTVRARDEIGELADSFNQMSADLARSTNQRKQMTADLAHDLRTPLSILRGYTEGLQDGRLAGSASLYRIMHGEVEHLQRLVEDLRVLSLADAGELPLNRRAVDPLALIERTALAYFDAAERQGVTLRVEQAGPLPSIQVDTDRMTQVLNNLVSNALHHTPSGEITLSAAARGRQVQIQVRDTGSGIAAEDLPHVFERFYRADKARQRTDGGSSGLGLAIAKAIVEAHGGTLAVASEGGRGTTFTIALDAVPLDASAPRREEPRGVGV